MPITLGSIGYVKREIPCMSVMKEAEMPGLALARPDRF